MKKKKKTILAISLTLIIGVSLVGTTIFLLSETVNEYETAGNYELSGDGKVITELKISNHIQKGDINVMMLPQDSSNILEAVWKLSYKSATSLEAPIIISFDEPESHFTINSALKTEDIIDLNLNISFNPNYINYSFRSDSAYSNLKFNAHGINYSLFEITSTSGNVDIQLNKSSIHNDFKISTDSGEINLMLDHLIFSKNFLCTSNSGDHFYDIWNIEFSTSSDFNASAISGEITARWANHFNKSHNVDINLNSENDVYLKLWSPPEIARFDIFYNATHGTTQFSMATLLRVQVGYNRYHSININETSVDFYNISAITNYGHVHVYIVDCFKWQRHCVQRNDFWPYDVQREGEYVIPRADHNVTSIEFYNMKYIYLDRLEYLDINFELLSNSSENAIHLVWDLTYKHAMRFGVGTVEILPSNKTEGDILKFYMALGFELDKILPTFSNCNITAFIHPDYSFYNYTI